MNAEAVMVVDIDVCSAKPRVAKPWNAPSFRAATAALLDQHGAVPAECSYADEFSLATPAGPLTVRVMDNWIATRFDDVALAKQRVGFGPSLNPFSGKWNFHDDAMNRRRLCQCFAETLARLMELPVLTT